MTDDLSADITALMKKLDEPQGGAETAYARLIVATDWAKGAMPLTALRAFRTLVPTNAPIQLVFAVPHKPSEIDAACIEVLVDEVGGAAGLTNLDVASFDAAVAQRYDTALVPTEDPEENLAQLGGFILRMRDLMRTHEASYGNSAAVSRNPGSQEALQERLAAYRP